MAKSGQMAKKVGRAFKSGQGLFVDISTFSRFWPIFEAFFLKTPGRKNTVYKSFWPFFLKSGPNVVLYYKIGFLGPFLQKDQLAQITQHIIEEGIK